MSCLLGAQLNGFRCHVKRRGNYRWYEAFHSPMIRASESPWIWDRTVAWHDSRPMGEYPILEGYSINFQQLSMRPFDLRSKGCQQPVSRLRLPWPSPRSRGRTLGDLTRCVRLSDVGMSYIVIKVSYKVGYKSIFCLLLSISFFVVFIASAKEWPLPMKWCLDEVLWALNGLATQVPNA